jgi:cytochrome c biogenesis protein CcmG, thiol:disulfide interchange protein DsbE
VTLLRVSGASRIVAAALLLLAGGVAGHAIAARVGDAAGRRPPAPVEVRAEPGSLAPDFALPNLDGRTVRLSEFRGRKAVLLNFWATWCPPCRAEMPTMERAYREYGPRGLEILAVTIDAGRADGVRAFMQELNLTFPALLDPDMTVLYAYRLGGIPGSFLIDRRGVVRAVEFGFRDWASAESRRKLEALLVEQSEG